MPTYEYECTACGQRFEQFQKMSDEPVRVCLRCGEPVRRRISGGSGIIFKGSGFYATDYGRSTTRCGRGSPCTARDIAAGLSIHLNEVVKYLEADVARGMLTQRWIRGTAYYQAAAAQPCCAGQGHAAAHNH